MTYGYTVDSQLSDVLVGTIDKMMKEFSFAAAPMAWAVDIVPVLQYLPDSFPGAAFKQTAREWRKSIQASAHIPYRFVRRQMFTWSYPPCYVSRLVHQLGKKEAENSAAKRRLSFGRPLVFMALQLTLR